MVITTISQNQTYLSKISGIKPWFALNPPKGGFRKNQSVHILKMAFLVKIKN